MFADAEQVLGQVDVLINNAGFNSRKAPLAETTLEEFELQYAVNRITSYNVCYTKLLRGVKALQNVSFSCREGTVHALMGENGAGKSTLLKILSGFQMPSDGVIKLGGKEVAFQNTVDALESGIAIIYQELHLVPEMTVAENIDLGQLPTRHGLIDKEKLYQDAARQLARLGIDVPPEMPLKYLSLGQWQMVEIAKALSRDARVIAFDEPTSSLSAREIEQLFRVIRQLRDEGKVILYVSHRMDEIRITSYNVCYTKLLRVLHVEHRPVAGDGWADFQHVCAQNQVIARLQVVGVILV